GESSQGEVSRWHKSFEAQKAEIAMLKKKLADAEAARESVKVEVEGLKTEVVTLKEKNLAMDLESFDPKAQIAGLEVK
ncbi:hypothetical protein OFM36_39565, partial [Escherichia coli]|nr:hypothetical protein [Escherichia coli]